ncbi:hypothetical protein GJAV_G00163510 [Gymnothorax javanicus]|nr:hypothetical protein GJAV_G00163510 [Gymnothorax javanicus]
MLPDQHNRLALLNERGHFMGENKMETLEKDTAQVECKQPDENEGGIRRRLRDRDLLRKKKAEAEEKAIYQWVYGLPSKRTRLERRSGPGRKGRPKKTETGILPQPPQEGASEDSRAEEELSQGSAPLQVEVELLQDSAEKEDPVTADADKPEELLNANIVEVAEEMPTDTNEQDGEEPLIIPVPAPEQAPQPESKSRSTPQLPEEGVAIEDLGPEEEEDDASQRRELVTEQGTNEGPGDNVTDSTQAFSIPSFLSPPQPSYFPGPSL